MDRKARIQGALRMRGNSQKTVAQAADVSEGTVSHVVSGKYPQQSASSRRTAAAVVRELARQSGIPIDELREDLTPAHQTTTDEQRTDAREHAPAA